MVDIVVKKSEAEIRQEGLHELAEEAVNQKLRNRNRSARVMEEVKRHEPTREVLEAYFAQIKKRFGWK